MLGTNGFTERNVGSYVDETEAWKRHHDEANECQDFEELVALGNSAYAAVQRWDTTWYSLVYAGKVDYRPEQEERIAELYRRWLAPADFILGEIARFEGRGYDLVGAEQFRANCEEGHSLLAPDPATMSPALVELEREALAAHSRGETAPFEVMGE